MGKIIQRMRDRERAIIDRRIEELRQAVLSSEIDRAMAQISRSLFCPPQQMTGFWSAYDWVAGLFKRGK
jgi:protein-L-isoaspartate O-methyltransferase